MESEIQKIIDIVTEIKNLESQKNLNVNLMYLIHQLEIYKINYGTIRTIEIIEDGSKTAEIDLEGGLSHCKETSMYYHKLSNHLRKQLEREIKFRKQDRDSMDNSKRRYRFWRKMFYGYVIGTVILLSFFNDCIIW